MQHAGIRRMSLMLMPQSVMAGVSPQLNILERLKHLVERGSETFRQECLKVTRQSQRLEKFTSPLWMCPIAGSFPN